jgi:hypothetical protein
MPMKTLEEIKAELETLKPTLINQNQLLIGLANFYLPQEQGFCVVLGNAFQ